jgi:hypothetical protein
VTSPAPLELFSLSLRTSSRAGHHLGTDGRTPVHGPAIVATP